MLLSLLLTVLPIITSAAGDEIRYTGDGRAWVVRTVDWPLQDGHSVRTTAHWQLLDNGRMRYDFDQQPPITQQAHRRSCAAKGMQPSQRGAWLSADGTLHGFHCSNLP